MMQTKCRSVLTSSVAAAPSLPSRNEGNDKLPAGAVAVGLLGVAFVSSVTMSTFLRSRGTRIQHD